MQTATTGKARNQGFTLIELMVVLIVAAILATWAIPYYRSFVSGQRIKTASFDVMSMLIYARSEAMKRNADVTLNMVGNQLVVTLASDSSVLRKSSALTGMKLDCKNTATNTYINCPVGGLTYNSYGRLTSAFPPIEIHANVDASSGRADTTDAYFRCVTISLSGQPYSRKGKC